MTDETRDSLEGLHERMGALVDEARDLLAKMGIHDQLREAHEDLRAALLARAGAEVAYMDLRMQRRDEWRDVDFGEMPSSDAGDCATSAAHVRARWRHEQADLRYRQLEVAWLEWVSSGHQGEP